MSPCQRRFLFGLEFFGFRNWRWRRLAAGPIVLLGIVLLGMVQLAGREFPAYPLHLRATRRKYEKKVRQPASLSTSLRTRIGVFPGCFLCGESIVWQARRAVFWNNADRRGLLHYCVWLLRVQLLLTNSARVTPALWLAPSLWSRTALRAGRTSSRRCFRIRARRASSV